MPILKKSIHLSKVLYPRKTKIVAKARASCSSLQPVSLAYLIREYLSLFNGIIAIETSEGINVEFILDLKQAVASMAAQP